LLALLTFAFVCFTNVSAQAQTTFTVDYRASEGCPDRGAFIHEVQRRSRIATPVGKAEQPKVVFVVELVRDAGKKRVTGKLVVTEGLATTNRVLTGKTCPEVASALALIAALTVDPNAEMTPLVEPLPLPPDPSGPPILTSKPALIEGPAPLLPSLPPPTPRPGKIPPTPDIALLSLPLPVWPLSAEVLAAPEPDRGLRGGLNVRFVSNVGAGPTPMVGIGGGGEAFDTSGIGWSIRAELSYLSVTGVTAVQDADSDYRMVRGHLRGCVPIFSPTPWFRLSPCGSLGGGAMFGELVKGAGFTEQSVSGTGPWLDAGASARAALVALDWLAIELEAGPTFPLIKAQFLNSSGQLHTAAPVNLDLALGASVAF